MSTAKKTNQKPAVKLAVIKGGKPQDKYHALFEQASDAIFSVLSNGSIDEVNNTFQELTGFHKDDIENQSVNILFPNPKKNHLPDRSRAFSLDHLNSAGTYEDIAVLRKDGFVRLVELSVKKVNGSKEPLTLVLMRDVTEKKKLEREILTKHAELRNAYVQLEKNNTELKSMQNNLVQAGKLAALGELSAGIAHELNQPLQGIRGYAQELESILGQEIQKEVRFSLNEIIHNVDKMAKIISYMRNFTRKSVEGNEWVEIKHSLDEAFRMLSRQYQSRGIQLELNISSESPKVYANPVQLEQVFINLLSNARDAIEETGRGSGSVKVSVKTVKEFVEIEFQDDGCGMREKTKQKAFNPFFTTKEVGKGMGVGLSLSYGLLNRIHGTILVESEWGVGTKFTIKIPTDYRELG